MSDIEALTRVLTARYSCRAFKADPVREDIMRQIIDAARHVPSWCNAQPWQITVTQPDATERFRAALQAEVASGTPQFDLAAPEGYPGIYGQRRRSCGWQLYDAVGVQKGDRAASGAQMMRNFVLFDAPHVAIISSPRALGGYGAMDTGGFVSAFTLAARALGVDTIAQAAIASYADFVRGYFDIDADRMILCAISFGYADPDHPANGFRTGRAGVDDILDLRT
ncbi:Nitroreductase NfnB [Roseobacter fucihabitans]|uniref:Nitroreductase NfnB n=1 Tax=Roseobacter fucihabitans TaxID=1537242 RepID=A0ABZ2BQU9_9RHOB|nr:nitroreductase [Roseobacter litoralis]MBC6967393.1 NADH dehydrogenase [Roseobacter litoralis]